MESGLTVVKLSSTIAVLAVVAGISMVIFWQPDNIRLEDDIYVVSDSPAENVLGDKPELLIKPFFDAASGEEVAQLTIDYPFNKSIFPPEIVAPTFLWHDPDENSDLWLIDVSFQDSPYHVYSFTTGKQAKSRIDPRTSNESNKHYKPSDYDLAAKAWTPTADTWNLIKDNSVEKTATVSICGLNKSDMKKMLSKASMCLTISKDPVGSPIFYRDVPLMPSTGNSGIINPIAMDALPLIEWRLRDISKAAAPLVLTDMPTCANCHSFSKDGKKFGMDIDGPTGDKGAYAYTDTNRDIVITKDDVFTWNDYKDTIPGHKNIGFFSQVSPDGNRVVSTVNQSVFVANYQNFEFIQSFYPTRGILAVYSKANGSMKALPGADDTDYVNSGAFWSPDGKELVFSRAKAKDKFTGSEMPSYSGDPKETFIQYDLYIIPFNDGKGGIPKPLIGASGNGKSNSFPKYSPDGKWIVFVQSEKGQLMRSDSKLFIVPAKGGKSRLMRCNLTSMNSWHSWSPNSRWLVFSSKGFTPFTQMFLTHIDEDGNDSPPILIPNSTASNRAVNIPEFLVGSGDAITSISVPVQQAYKHFGKGKLLAVEGKFAEAAAEFKKTLELNPFSFKAHNSLGFVTFKMGKTAKAIEHCRRSLQIDPKYASAYNTLGRVLEAQGKLEDAAKHYRHALKIKPYSPDFNCNLAELDEKQKKYNEASDYYQRALKIQPKMIRAKYGLARTLQMLGKNSEAVKYYRELIEITNDSAAIRYGLAVSLLRLDQVDEALECYYVVLKSNPDNSITLNTIAWVLATNADPEIRKPADAVKYAEKACKINPNEPQMLDTLAAAYASDNRFGLAMKIAEKAIKMATSVGNGNIADEIRKHLESYKAGKAWVE